MTLTLRTVGALLLLASPVQAASLQATPATVARVLTQARAGDTVVLAPGSYGEIRCTGQCAPGLTIAGQAGTTVRSLAFTGTGTHHLTVRGVTVDGQHQARETVFISRGAGYIRILDTEIRHATAHGIHSPSASSGHNVFLRVYVHDNGTRSHFDHGLYLSSPANQVLDSRVERNAGYGVHLYAGGKQTAHETLVQGNTITDNGTKGGTTWGILLSDGRNQQAIGNTLRNNGTGDISVWVNAPGAVLRGNRTQGRVEVRAPWQVQMEEEGGDEVGEEALEPSRASLEHSPVPTRLRLLGSRP